MRREFTLFFAVGSYFLCALSMVWSLGFLGNLYGLRTIDSAALLPFGNALTVNSCLIALFSLLHINLEQGFAKAWLVSVLEPSLHRSVTVLVSSVGLLTLMLLWQPMGGIVWALNSSLLRHIIIAIYFGGWIFMFYATFLINHFELLGLRQAWMAYEGGDHAAPMFRTPGLYRRTRHPIYLGWLIILWAAPTMTLAHLLLAAGMTSYILIAIQREEHGLDAELPEYLQYKRKVPMLLPSWRKCLHNDEIDRGNVFESKARGILSHEKRGRFRHRFSLKL